jgi:hypothetical protein
MPAIGLVSQGRGKQRPYGFYEMHH